TRRCERGPQGGSEGSFPVFGAWGEGVGAPAGKRATWAERNDHHPIVRNGGEPCQPKNGRICKKIACSLGLHGLRALRPAARPRRAVQSNPPGVERDPSAPHACGVVQRWSPLSSARGSHLSRFSHDSMVGRSFTFCTFRIPGPVACFKTWTPQLPRA